MATNKTQRVTMSDVARRAGVSRTTVSFVLNDKPGATIPDETRRRILKAIDELGYRPNAGARALAANRSGWFGLITEIVTGPFAAEVITGAQSRAWGDRRFLLIAASEGDPAQEAAALDQMLEHRVEGLLYATTWHRAVSLPKAAREVPTVLVNCYDAAGELPCILPDEVSGGYKATRRLLDAGHTRIGFINLDPEIPAAIGRREGYERALRGAGITLDPSSSSPAGPPRTAPTPPPANCWTVRPPTGRPLCSAATTGWRWARTTRSRNVDCVSRTTWPWWGSTTRNSSPPICGRS